MEVDPHAPVGLFSFDTRFLSRWVLTIDGERMHALSRDDMTYFETRFVLVPGAASHYVDADVSVIRHRSIDDSFTRASPCSTTPPSPPSTRSGWRWARLRRHLRDPQPGARRVTPATSPSRRRAAAALPAGAVRPGDVVSSTVPAEVDEGGMTFRIRVDRARRVDTDLHVGMIIRGRGRPGPAGEPGSHRQRVRQDMREDLGGGSTGRRSWCTDARRLPAAYEQA